MCSLLVIGFLMSRTSYAVENVIKNDTTGVPDKALYTSMLESGDSNKDGILTQKEIEKIESIYVFSIDKDIDLTGLELATNLKTLSMTANSKDVLIKNLDKTLSLTSIRDMSIYGFGFVDTTVLSQLTSLMSLNLGNSNIKEVTWVSSLKNLISLDLSNSKLNDISTISKLNKLNNLTVSNHFEEEPFNFDTLDTSKLSELGHLSINNFKLNDWTKIGQISTLEYLNLSETDITNTDWLNKLTHTKELFIYSCDLKNMNTVLDFSKMSNLEKLTIYGSQLTMSPSFANLKKLTNINLSSNNIGNIDNLAGLTQFKQLDLSSNQLTNISKLSSLTNLIGLDVSGNKLESIPNLKSLINLDFENHGDIHNYYITNFSKNRLLSDDLINNLPEKVKNYPQWIEDNAGRLEHIEIDIKEDETLSVNDIVSELNDKWVSAITVFVNGNLTFVPKEIIQEIIKTNKPIYIMNADSVWNLTPKAMKNVKGNLSLEFSVSSLYENKIKTKTNESNLSFITFIANEDIVYKIENEKYPINIWTKYSSFVNSKSENLYIYSYDSVLDLIKKIGTIPNEMDEFLNIPVILEKNANTIFVSDKDGLDSVKEVVPNPDKPEITPKDKVINSPKIPTGDIIDALKDKNISNITVNIKESDTISNELLKSIKSSQKSVTFNILTAENKTKYSWSFDGKDMKNIDNLNLDLNINFRADKQKEIEKITNQTNMFYLQFSYHGQLPAPTTIKVDVSSQYKDGESIYLYYFNEDKGTIEKASSAIKVQNGYAEFIINHCSTYFLTKDNSKITQTPTTSDNSNIGLVTLFIGVSALGIYLLHKKRVQN